MSKELPVIFQKKRRQKTLRIRVRPDAVYVSAPMFTSQRSMQKFLDEHSQWVNKQIQRLSDFEARREEVLKESLNRFMINGKEYSIRWQMYKMARYQYKFIIDKAEELVISCPLECDQRAVKVLIYKRLADRILKQRFEIIKQEMGYSVHRIYIRSQKTKWGTCSSKGNISLNWRLVKCPDWVQDYICVHELCHLKEMNHSKSFWKLVKSFRPDYKKAEDWLRKHEQMLFID